MPWEISLLVGGGFALAEGTKVGSSFNGNPIISAKEKKERNEYESTRLH